MSDPKDAAIRAVAKQLHEHVSLDHRDSAPYCEMCHRAARVLLDLPEVWAWVEAGKLAEYAKGLEKAGEIARQVFQAQDSIGE